jgi:hypothetical protein
LSGEQLNADPGICREVDRDLICRNLVSRFCEFWIRNTMRKVMMVVPVLMVSCQTSEKPKTGPDKAHATTTATAAKAVGLPAQREAAEATREKAFSNIGAPPPKSLRASVILNQPDG